MNQRISTSLTVGFCALLLFAEVGIAQEQNPTVWPYGGAPDQSRMTASLYKPPLNFDREADFIGANFYGSHCPKHDISTKSWVTLACHAFR